MRSVTEKDWLLSLEKEAEAFWDDPDGGSSYFAGLLAFSDWLLEEGEDEHRAGGLRNMARCRKMPAKVKSEPRWFWTKSPYESRRYIRDHAYLVGHVFDRLAKKDRVYGHSTTYADYVLFSDCFYDALCVFSSSWGWHPEL